MLKKLSCLFLLCSFLSACQTGPDSRLQGWYAQEYAHLVANRCIMVKTLEGTKIGSESKFDTDIIIYSVVEGKDSWRRIDFSSKGLRGNVYHNIYSEEFVCGWRNWNKKSLNDIFTNPKKLTDTKTSPKIDTSTLDPTQKVICEVAKGYVGGDRLIELYEDKCILRGGRIIKRIKSLPAHIGRNDYIQCRAYEDPKPVTMKAMVCMQINGEIVE